MCSHLDLLTVMSTQLLWYNTDRTRTKQCCSVHGVTKSRSPRMPLTKTQNVTCHRIALNHTFTRHETSQRNVATDFTTLRYTSSNAHDNVLRGMGYHIASILSTISLPYEEILRLQLSTLSSQAMFDCFGG